MPLFSLSSGVRLIGQREAVQFKSGAFVVVCSNLLFHFPIIFLMSDFPEALKRQLIPNGQRRAPWHDYYGRSIYMITLNAASGVPRFSSLKGIPGNRDWPPYTVLTPLGEIIAKSLSSIKANFPFTKIIRRVIMPEHVHFVLYVTEKTEYHLGDIISWLKGACTRA